MGFQTMVARKLLCTIINFCDQQRLISTGLGTTPKLPSISILTLYSFLSYKYYFVFRIQF